MCGQFSLFQSQNRCRLLHPTASRHSHLFSATIGWRETPAKEPLERAEDNNYKLGAHQVEDSIKDNTKYVKKTLEDQIGRWEAIKSKRKRRLAPAKTFMLMWLSRKVDAVEKKKVI